LRSIKLEEVSRTVAINDVCGEITIPMAQRVRSLAVNAHHGQAGCQGLSTQYRRSSTASVGASNRHHLCRIPTKSVDS
jgi:hypothetical protein